MRGREAQGVHALPICSNEEHSEALRMAERMTAGQSPTAVNALKHPLPILEKPPQVPFREHECSAPLVGAANARWQMCRPTSQKRKPHSILDFTFPRASNKKTKDSKIGKQRGHILTLTFIARSSRDKLYCASLSVGLVYNRCSIYAIHYLPPTRTGHQADSHSTYCQRFLEHQDQSIRNIYLYLWK